MTLTVQMRGYDALSLRTKRLIGAARSGLKFAVSEAAELVVQEAKMLVPVKTGRLQAAIHQEPLVNQPEIQSVLVAAANLDPSEAVGFEPPYARRIELGFAGSDSRGRIYNQPAQPFMRSAWDGKRDQVSQTIRDGVFEQVAAAHSR